MTSAFGYKVSFTSLLRTVKSSKPDSLAIGVNASYPFIATFDNSHKPSFIIAMRLMQILHINGLSNASKVAKSIIARIAVYMVNMIGWKFASHIKPCETVAKPELIVQSKHDVTLSIFSGNNGAYFGFSAGYFNSSEKPRIWVIGKNRLQSFLGKHITSAVNNGNYNICYNF